MDDTSTTKSKSTPRFQDLLNRSKGELNVDPQDLEIAYDTDIDSCMESVRPSKLTIPYDGVADTHQSAAPADPEAGPEPIEEEAEEMESVYEQDQLPSVEEIKASVDSNGMGSSFPSLRRLTITLIVFAVLVTVSAVGFAVARGEKDPQNKLYQPTEAEMRDRYEDLVQFLVEQKVSPEPSLRSPGDPQEKAAKWLSEVDIYHAYVLDMSPENYQRHIERFVMATIFYHFHGEQWTYRLNFLKSTDTCNWFTNFLTAGGDKIRMGVDCNEDGLVTKVVLREYTEYFV